jgi:hypothetical protein
MSAFTLVKSEVVDLTFDIAKQFREMKPTPTERDLDPKRVEYLKERIEKGWAVPFHLATVKVTATGEVYRANGQHGSEMLFQLDGKMPTNLKAHIDHFEVPDMEGAALLFKQIDNRGSSRTARDVSGVFQGIVPELVKVDKKVAKIGIEGIAWWRRQIEKVPVPSGDSVYDLFGEAGLHSYLIWLGGTIDMKTPELAKPPVAAAMYATFIVDEAMARTFWHDVARGGVEYEDNHPSTVLDEWLKEAHSPKSDLNPAQGQVYQGCIYAWNAAREDKTLKDIKYDTKKGFHKAI